MILIDSSDQSDDDVQFIANSMHPIAHSSSSADDSSEEEWQEQPKRMFKTIK